MTLIVVGGGASGLIAAVTAARRGASVTLIERNPRIGKKLLVTGNGRCNYTNTLASEMDYFCPDTSFVKSCLSQFSPQAAIDFFQELGIEPKVESHGKVFPMSEQASSFLDVFLHELNHQNVQVITDCLVESITKKKEFVVQTTQGTFRSDKLIFCPGGKAMPSTGSDGTAYDLVKPLGHRITDIYPTLVQLMLEGDFYKRIEGVKLKGKASISSQGQTLHKEEGDLLFANYGISGPPILQLSRTAGRLLHEKKPATLHLTLLPYRKEELIDILKRRMLSDKSLEHGLIGLINKRLIPVLIQQAGITDRTRAINSLSPKEIEALANIMTNWTIPIRGTKSWPSAQATAGGIDTVQVNPETMESTKEKDLYFAGEVLDVDGLCGGYNLQWAWASGYVAAIHATS